LRYARGAERARSLATAADSPEAGQASRQDDRVPLDGFPGDRDRRPRIPSSQARFRVLVLDIREAALGHGRVPGHGVGAGSPVGDRVSGEGVARLTCSRTGPASGGPAFGSGSTPP